MIHSALKAVRPLLTRVGTCFMKYTAAEDAITQRNKAACRRVVCIV